MRRFKALSPIVAVLLLIIIAAVASTLLFVWFSGYFSTTASKAAEMQSLALSIKKAEVIAGTNATATTKPERTSFLIFADEYLFKSNNCKTP